MATKTIKRTVRMTPEMYRLLVQVVAKQGRQVTEVDLIREAIRQYLDEQTDMVGSRRHFQKTLQLRLDRLENTLTFQMNVLLYLLAAILADDSAIDDAILTAKQDGASLIAQMGAVRDRKDEG